MAHALEIEESIPTCERLEEEEDDNEDDNEDDIVYHVAHKMLCRPPAWAVHAS